MPTPVVQDPTRKKIRFRDWISRRAITAWTCLICGSEVPGNVTTCC